MGTLFTALGAATALSNSNIFPVHQGGARALGATGTQLLALVGTAYVPLAGGTMTGALTIASGSLAASAPALSITQTWNGSGVSFRGIDVNITNTLSGTSYPIVMTVSGSNVFYVNQVGDIYGVNYRLTSNNSTIGLGASADVLLVRDAAAQLALRNGTNQQSFSVYNRYTDSSNYERLKLTGVAGTSVNITAETLGTGGDNLDIVLTPAGNGSVVFPNSTYINSTGFGILSGIKCGTESSLNYYASGLRLLSSGEIAWTNTTLVNAPVDTALFRDSAGVVKVTDGGSNYRDLKLRNLLNVEYHQMTEMTAPSAPATNSVRIYAEDNGSGKTRLMALFATGAAQQLAIEP